MKIYHYSSEPREEILNMHLQGREREGFDNDIRDPFNYNFSTSWFMDKLPINLPEILEYHHEFWVKGAVYYEHEFDVDDLPKTIHFRLTEAHEKTQLVFEEQDWDSLSDDPYDPRKMKYLKQINDLEVKLGYKGMGLVHLKKAIKKSNFNYIEDYKKALAIHREHYGDELMSKYAPCVPHLMLYSPTFVYRPDKIRKVTFK